MKVISETTHGILDYLTVAIFRRALRESALPALWRSSHTRSLPFILS